MTRRRLAVPPELLCRARRLHGASALHRRNERILQEPRFVFTLYLDSCLILVCEKLHVRDELLRFLDEKTIRGNDDVRVL
jgi:hypothetical protein